MLYNIDACKQLVNGEYLYCNVKHFTPVINNQVKPHESCVWEVDWGFITKRFDLSSQHNNRTNWHQPQWDAVLHILAVQMDSVDDTICAQALLLYLNTIISQNYSHYSWPFSPCILRWWRAPPPPSASWSLVLDFPGQSSLAECFPLPSPPHTVAASL